MIKKLKEFSMFLIKEIILLLIGGIVYYMIETAFRGYSHWTMFLLGGFCFIILGLINEFFDWDSPTFCSQCLIGCFIITSLEFVVGMIVNVKLGWNVWDYSDKMLNLKGQICLENSSYWVVLSGFAIVIDDYLRYFLFKEEKPHYTII